MNVKDFSDLLQIYGIFLRKCTSKYNSDNTLVSSKLRIDSIADARAEELDEAMREHIKIIRALRDHSSSEDEAIVEAYNQLITIVALKK